MTKDQTLTTTVCKYQATHLKAQYRHYLGEKNLKMSAKINILNEK